MNARETILLDRYDMLVTPRHVTVSGVTYPIGQISAVRVESTSAYAGKAIPFALALMCVIWGVAEVVNAPPSYGWAAVAFLLALMAGGAVRLVGGCQTHTVYLSMRDGEKPLFQSRDGKAVSALVSALRQALADRGPSQSTAWHTHRVLHG